MADYELQGEITTNTIDSEILSAPIIESEMMLGDTVVIDHYYNGLESDTVKVTVDNDNNTIKADAVVDEKPTKNSNHLVTSGTIQNTNVMRNYVHLSSAASYNDVYTLLDNGNGCGIIPRISDTFIPFPDYLPPSPFAGQSVGDLTLFARITGRSSGTNLELEFTLLTLYDLEPAYKLNAYSHGTSGWTNTGWYKYDAAVLDFAESEYQKSKNLNPYPYINSSLTVNGITFKVNADQSITANGTISDSGTNAVIYLNYGLLIEAGTYTISATKSIEDDKFTASLFDGTNYYDSNSTFTLTEPKKINVYAQIRKTSTSTYTNANIKVMLCKGTDTDWQPYNGAILRPVDIAPVVLYDKNSANPSINKGYTSGIMSDGVGNVRVSIDFSPYKKVKIYANLDRMNAVSEYDFTSGTNQFSVLCGDIASARAKVNYMSGYISNTEFRPVFAGLAETAKDNNANYYVYRIEGIK